MNEKDIKRIRKDSRYRIFLISLISVALGVVVFTSSIFGWFSFKRNMNGVTQISNPTAIFIGSGHQEDIMYMDLTDIDLIDGSTYKDYVFCIRGTNVVSYQIQLAFTTNNQFNYEILPASEVSNEEDVPGNAKSVVTYYTQSVVHNDELNIDEYIVKYYYVANGVNALSGNFKNKNNGSSEILAKDDDQYFNETYGESKADPSPYDNVHKYAVPLYWQSTTLDFTDDGIHTEDFCDYYVLRITWVGENRTNNKETDIIYITAENKSE